MAGKMDELAMLKTIVQKDGTERLIREMLLGQSHFDEDHIRNFSRSQLISYVVVLRNLAKQTGAVTGLVKGFDPKMVVFEEEIGESKEETLKKLSKNNFY